MSRYAFVTFTEADTRVICVRHKETLPWTSIIINISQLYHKSAWYLYLIKNLITVSKKQQRRYKNINIKLKPSYVNWWQFRKVGQNTFMHRGGSQTCNGIRCRSLSQCDPICYSFLYLYIASEPDHTSIIGILSS